MAKRKKKTVSHRRSKSDNSLMFLAGAAALLVGFFAIFVYKSQASMPLPTPTPNATITLNLFSQNGSSQVGIATLQQGANGVIVTLNIPNEPASAVEASHIHSGTCTKLGAIQFPLNSIVNGVSTTTLNTTLQQLHTMEPLAIDILKSASQPNLYVSCTNLEF